MVDFLINITFDRSGGFQSNKLRLKDWNLLYINVEETYVIIFGMLQKRAVKRC